MAARLALALIRAYQLIMAPLLTGSCRFAPSCSVYAAEAIRHHGVIRGAWSGCGEFRNVIRLGLPVMTPCRPVRASDGTSIPPCAFFCFLVLYVYQVILPKPASPPATSPNHRHKPHKVNKLRLRARRRILRRLAPEASGSPPIVAETVERDVPFETDLVSAVFSNRARSSRAGNSSTSRIPASPTI